MAKLLVLLVTLLFLATVVQSSDLECGPTPAYNRLNFRKRDFSSRGMTITNARISRPTSNLRQLVGDPAGEGSNYIEVAFEGRTLSSVVVDFVACGGGDIKLWARDPNNGWYFVSHATLEPCEEGGLKKFSTEKMLLIEAQGDNGKIDALSFSHDNGQSCPSSGCFAIREIKYHCDPA